MKKLLHIIVCFLFGCKKDKLQLAQLQIKPEGFDFSIEQIQKNGFGSNATGGEGGVNYYVKNESDLRLALNQGHARTIYIKGIIELTDRLNISKGNFSLIGVTNIDEIRGYGTYISAKNFIIQNIQFSATDKSGKNEDSLAFRHGAENGMIDNCVAAFSVDENVDFWGGKNITLQNSLIVHALRNSVHSEGSHSMGILIGSGATNITIYHNIFAFNQNRHARVGAGSKVEFINNIIYGHKTNYVLSENSYNTVVNNVYLKGTQTVTHNKLVDVTDVIGTKVYIEGNINDFGASEKDSDLINENEMPIYSGVEIKPTEGLLENWEKTVKPKRPYVKKVIKDIHKKRGQIIDSQTEIEY